MLVLFYTIIVKYQIKLNRETDEAYKGTPDPLFTYDVENGKDYRSIITRYMKDNLPDHLTS